VITALAFVAAAGVGALARAEAGRRWNRHEGFPFGTVAVNVSGSFLVGLLSGLGSPALTIIGVGGLGAYTTFSSFGRDAVALADVRGLKGAGVYVAATCLLGIGAAALGVAISGS
jgi:fluoride exporter